jgi:hypothetical protein
MPEVTEFSYLLAVFPTGILCFFAFLREGEGEACVEFELLERQADVRCQGELDCQGLEDPKA